MSTYWIIFVAQVGQFWTCPATLQVCISLIIRFVSFRFLHPSMCDFYSRHECPEEVGDHVHLIGTTKIEAWWCMSAWFLELVLSG